MLVAVASTTLHQIKSQQLPLSAADSIRDFAVAVAERLGGFEFIRDLHVLGMTIGIETDIESAELVHAAARRGLRVEASGERGIRLQLPLVISDDDRDALLIRIGEAMEVIERATTEIGA